MADGLRNQYAPPLPPPLPPPPAPPLPPQRYAHRATSALARLAHPFLYGSRPPSPQPGLPQDPPVALSAPPRSSISRVSSPPTIALKTGVAISAVDISPQRTHAVVAGREILRTIRVAHDECAEDFDLRGAIINYSSAQHSTGALAAKHKDQLTAKDVKWSHAEYDRTIATAAANGRIVVYDLARPGLELGRFQEHSRQVHRLAFNPHRAAWLLSGSQDATIRMWDLRMFSGDRGVMTFGSKHRFNSHSEAVRDIRWSPRDGVQFASATDSGVVQCWDVRKENAPLLKINAHERSCSAIDWHPDGKHVVSGSVDRQVKVWDFSSTDRRQKPVFLFRAPQSVSNVRWRPPSWSGDAEDRGEWQSTQLVTSYETDDPRIHLWDLRRPHVPYREFDHHSRLVTDLLWHSDNLLWTVNGEGTFTQTDMNLAPRIINRRKPCSIAWSPNGSVVAFANKRQNRRKRSINFGPAEFLGPSVAKGTNSSGDKSLINQSLTDEGLDDTTLASSIRRRPGKASYARGSKSQSGTPPAADEFVVPARSLEKAVAESGVFEPSQSGIIGHIPGSTLDSELFRYLVQHYAAMGDLENRVSSASVHEFLNSFDENAIQADNVSLHRLAQTWRVLGYIVGLEISTHVAGRAASGQDQTGQRSAYDAGKALSPKDRVPNKIRSFLFKGVVESQQGPTFEPVSTSNMTTPLAQPVPDSPADTFESSYSQRSGLENEFGGISNLPPPVFPSSSSAISSGSRPGRRDSGGEQIGGVPIQTTLAQTGYQGHGRSLSPSRMHEQEQAALRDLLADGQRSAPRAIARRADWRLRNNDDDREGVEPLEEDYDQRVEEKRAALRDYKHLPKRILNLDPLHQDHHPRAPTYARHDSSESFPMFSASTDSSQRAKSSVDPSSPRARPDLTRLDSAGWSGKAESPLEDIPELDIGSPPDSYRGRTNHHQSMEENSSFEDHSPSGSERIHLERPSRPLPFLAETLSADTLVLARDAAGWEHDVPAGRDSSGIVLPISPSAEDENKPWSAPTTIREAIRHYASSSAVDILTAAHLLYKLHRLFSSLEEILPYEERELIFKTYNDLLLRHGMCVEAAELRVLLAPSYPSVYDYAQKDTFINVFCFECNKPYENPVRDGRRCHRCNIPQPPCTVCMSQDPPTEWTTAFAPHSHTATLEYPGTNTTSSSLCSSPTDKPKEHPTQARDSDHVSSHPSAAPCVPDTAFPTQGTTHRSRGTALWSWCQGCGHGAHTACLTTWLNDLSMSEGGCATPGCLHDCGPGPRREQNRATKLEATKRARDAPPVSRKAGLAFVKRDSRAAGESKAVERVRGMLSSGSGGSGGAAGPSSAPSSGSGIISPKKVRLVTPGTRDPGTDLGGEIGILRRRS